LSDRTFRVSLVGCGRISRNHVDAISRIDGLEIVAVSDESADVVHVIDGVRLAEVGRIAVGKRPRGMGLSLPLDGFAFSFDDVEPRISFAPKIADAPERWTFRTIDVLGHRIALALETADLPPILRLHDVTRLSATSFEIRSC